MLQGKKILVVGATGMVGQPIAEALASDNEVWAVARFQNAEARAKLESLGVNCVTADLLAGDLSAVPTDCDHVLNFAVSYSQTADFDYDLRLNAEAAGLLMAHCKDAGSFLHCSSTAVYQIAGRTPRTEDAPLGDYSHASQPTYSITKIAAEAVVRSFCRQFDVPTVIARLNVPYSDTSGWPFYHVASIAQGNPVYVHTDAPNVFAPIHTDDMVRTLPALLSAASVPADIINWGGTQHVSIEEWSAHIGELLGKPAEIAHTDQTLSSVIPDVSKLQALMADEITSVDWRDGIARLVATFNAD